MAIKTPKNRNLPMTGIPQRAGLFLAPNELTDTPDVVLSVLLSTIHEAIHLAKRANQIGTWHDLVSLESVVGDEMRRRYEIAAMREAEQESRVRLWDAECADVEVGPVEVYTLETFRRDASDLGVA